MTDNIAAISPRPLPAPTPTNNIPGLEYETVETGDTGQFWSTEEGPTFAEFLDIINPLQHIPLVSSIYRAISGDEIGPGPRFIGGMLFGGPIGALVAGVSALFQEASGGDLGKHIAELVDDFTGDGDSNPAVSAEAAQAAGAAGVAGAAAPAAKLQQAALSSSAIVAASPAALSSSAIVAVSPAALSSAAASLNRISPVAAGETGAKMLRAAPKSPEPPAATLNRIALNPAAALGAPQGIPRHGAARLPTGEKIFPARAMKMPFGAPAGAAARQTGAQVRAQIRAQIPAQNPDQIPAQIPAQTDPANLAARTNANDRPNTCSRAAQGTEQIDSPLARSRRQQADLMLAQWAAQQMAQQNGASAARRAGNDDSKGNPRGAAAQPESPAHPMLAPPNASPEWYAQAMDKALNRYRTGSQAQPIAGPASRVSITR